MYRSIIHKTYITLKYQIEMETPEKETKQLDYYTKNEYYKLLCDIRNMRVLTSTNRIILEKCEREQLLEIIEIYNLIMKNVNYLFS